MGSGRQEAGAKTVDPAHKCGLSTPTRYNWTANYCGPDVSEVSRLKAPEKENRKLMKLLAESVLDVAALKELLTINGRARRQSRGCRSSPTGSPPTTPQAHTPFLVTIHPSPTPNISSRQPAQNRPRLLSPLDQTSVAGQGECASYEDIGLAFSCVYDVECAVHAEQLASA